MVKKTLKEWFIKQINDGSLLQNKTLLLNVMQEKSKPTSHNAPRGDGAINANSNFRKSMANPRMGEGFLSEPSANYIGGSFYS